MLVSLVAVAATVATFWLGRRSVSGRRAAFAALWRYQQALNDCGHEIDTLVHTNDEALSDTSRDELRAARELAYRHATVLRPEARGLLVRATVPSMADVCFDLVDLAHAYLALAEHLAEEIVRVQLPNRRWKPFGRDVAASRVPSV